MRYIKLGGVRAFPNVRPDKAQALKVLEEAAEVVEALKGYERFIKEIDYIFSECMPKTKIDLMDEIADTITACCNLAAALGVTDLTPYLARCEERNRKRGRYE